MSTTEQRKKYVVLEHLQLPNRGFRFWTTNTENNTHSFKGDLWYKEVLFTDSTEEAIAMSRIANVDQIPSMWELEEHYQKEISSRKTSTSSHVSRNI
jgi:hypothetical protein